MQCCAPVALKSFCVSFDDAISCSDLFDHCDCFRLIWALFKVSWYSFYLDYILNIFKQLFKTVIHNWIDVNINSSNWKWIEVWYNVFPKAIVICMETINTNIENR